MGRGRQKAKHTKIARELKSYSPDVNFASLQRELGRESSEYDDLAEKYADYGDDDEDHTDD